MTNGKPHYTIEPLFYKMMDEVISWAAELEIFLILDNHTFDNDNTSPSVEPILISVWTQMADH